MANEPLLQLELPGIRKIKRGKVREIFDLGDRLLMVASDRISAFDCILPNGIPRKGEVLTQISFFWFERFASLVPNHLLAGANDPLPPALQPFAAAVGRRSMIVKKAQPLAIECVVRGYLAGSGWKEYQKTQTVCGISLPPGLKESSELPEPIFTPSTKAETGHDENISFEQAARGRKISLRRLDTLALPGAGMSWDIGFMFRGKPRQLVADIRRFDRPELLEYAGVSSSFEAALALNMISLSSARTRLHVVLEMKPRTLGARLLIQSAKLGRGNLERKFTDRITRFGQALEARARQAGV